MASTQLTAISKAIESWIDSYLAKDKWVLEGTFLIMTHHVDFNFFNFDNVKKHAVMSKYTSVS